MEDLVVKQVVFPADGKDQLARRLQANADGLAAIDGDDSYDPDMQRAAGFKSAVFAQLAQAVREGKAGVSAAEMLQCIERQRGPVKSADMAAFRQAWAEAANSVVSWVSPAMQAA